MKIEKIIIENYKSIKHMEIPMSNDYGKSDTVFLLGINESGKSSMLEAIHRLKAGFAETEYPHVCYATSQEKSEEVRITAFARPDDEEHARYMRVVSEQIPVLGDDVNKIAKIQITKSVFCRRAGDPLVGEDLAQEVIFDDDFPFGKYVCPDGTTVALADSENELDSDEESENLEDSLLTSETLASIVWDSISGVFWAKFPEILYWKSAERYLIADAINLVEYKENTSMSVPLTNMFLLNKEEEIKNAIEVALSSDGQKAGLEERLSDVTTRHINKVWRDHPVNIKAKIHGESMVILVEDKKEKHTFLTVQQRSDGFKQFISLLLTLSAECQEGVLENAILLLDEPEAHLHPSGIRLMRDEIFKMARNNKIFVATHSPSMVDIKTPHRHWVVEKTAGRGKGGKLQTKFRRVDKDMSMKDEEVLRQAFGINAMKEILPDNLLLVEGETDKQLLQFALYHLEERGDISFTIKSAKGSKMPTLANMLDSHGINAVIFLDADGAGKEMQEKIIENRSSFNKNNVFTLEDLIDGLPKRATIEDLILLNSVQKCLRASGWSCNFAADEDARILDKIASANSQHAKDKKAMSDIKLKMAEQAINDYHTCDSKQEYARLFQLAEKLLEKIRAHRRS